MNELLRKYLLSLNCMVINPISKSIHDDTTVGWHCKSTSQLRITDHLGRINKFIKENNLPYYISDSEDSVYFFIYIND